MMSDALNDAREHVERWDEFRTAATRMVETLDNLSDAAFGMSGSVRFDVIEELNPLLKRFDLALVAKELAI